MNAIVEQSLLSKIRTLTPQQVAEVDDFVGFLSARPRKNVALYRLLAITPALEAAGIAPMSEEEIATEIRAQSLGQVDRPSDLRQRPFESSRPGEARPDRVRVPKPAGGN